MLVKKIFLGYFQSFIKEITMKVWLSSFSFCSIRNNSKLFLTFMMYILHNYKMKHITLISLLVFLTISCINRQDAINRSLQWVKAGVPYDANKLHDGYVQGCSGLVGYAWGYPKTGGVASGELIPSGTCKQINKTQLLQGDIMVCPGKHELLFHAWFDSTKSSYWGIEMSGTKGAVRRQIPYPYFSTQSPGCYVACRVVKACTAGETNGINTTVE